MAIDNWHTSEEKLPELGEGHLPPLELSWDVLEEEHTRKKPITLVVQNPDNNVEFPRSEMNQLDDNIPVLKVRDLRRLKNIISPNPPEFTYIKQENPSPTHSSEESDHEKKIELKNKIERLVFGKEPEDEFDDNAADYFKKKKTRSSTLSKPT
jgi:hypothetical protein